MFYLLVGLYAFSTAGIILRSSKVGEQLPKLLLFLVAVQFIYSALFGNILTRLFGDIHIQNLLVGGMALLKLVMPNFEPSLFGTLLISGIFLFITGYRIAAIALMVFTCTIHSNYLLPSAYFVSAAMWIAYREDGNLKKPILYGLLALALVTPQIIYLLNNFGATSPELHEEAGRVMVYEYVPYHMDTLNWFGWDDLFRLGLLGLALYFARGTMLFYFIGIPVFLATLLTIVQLISGNVWMAITYPWRVTTLLMPLASCMVIGGMVDLTYDRYKTSIDKKRLFLFGLLGAISLLMVAGGIYRTYSSHEQAKKQPEIPIMNYVRKHMTAKDVYMIPPDMERFRLYTGAPTFVDGKAHPFRDVEFLEWWRRLNRTVAFYEEPNERACASFEAMRHDFTITHVIVPAGARTVACPGWNKLFEDSNYLLFAVSSSPKNPPS